MNTYQCNDECNVQSWRGHVHCDPCRPTFWKTGECVCECHNCDEATSEYVRYRQRRNQGNGRDD